MADVVFDACVLVPFHLCDAFLRLAENGIFTPRWTETILEEVHRTLEPMIGLQNTSRRIQKMRGAFHHAMVTGYESRISRMTNALKDRHVAAAAVQINAPILVTDNLRHFPAASLAEFCVAALSRDDFLMNVYSDDAARFHDVLRRQADGYRKPPLTFGELLDRLAKHAPTLVTRIVLDLL